MQQGLQEQQNVAARIEKLVQEVATFTDPHARATAEELVQALLDMYGEGLVRILDLTVQSEASGQALIEKFANDELLGALFMLHGLHPVDLETRVAQALVEVRPYLKSHGGNVELIKVEDGVAYLRLEGSCHGCPSSTMTLKMAIEEAIYKAAPDLDDLKVEGVVEPPPRPGKPVAFIPPRRNKSTSSASTQEGGWHVVGEGLVPALASLPPGTVKVVTVQDKPLLFCQIADTYYAYANHCSSCDASLTDSRLEGTTLICSSCGRFYDVSRAGRCLDLDAANLFLEPVPLLIEGGKVKVALSALAKDDVSSAVVSVPAR
jgi:Fe-S cluster biogenesis protein NfuA/nitrite reductase/ring-hydroxylating ferredoxin subunit